MHDWKVVALFYSGLHRVNYWLAMRTGRAPASHFERKRRVEGGVRQVFSAYRDLYLMSMRARYRDGLRTRDYHRARALALLIQLEAAHRSHNRGYPQSEKSFHPQCGTIP